MDNLVDWDFISVKEGGTKTIGFVPVCTAASVINPRNRTCFGKPTGSVIGKSGVTIGTSVDLGQMAIRELQKLNLPDHLFNTFKLFGGKKKDGALTALSEYEKNSDRSLQITLTDAKVVNQKINDKTLGQLVKNYNDYSDNSFASLRPEAQTALASFAFQYGPNIYKSKNEFVQNVWTAYISQDFQILPRLLRNPPEYVDRRKEEAYLIDEISI